MRFANAYTTETGVLKSWTEFSDQAIKYFSGTARYTKTFNVFAGKFQKSDAEKTLRASGLLGPARLQFAEIVLLSVRSSLGSDQCVD